MTSSTPRSGGSAGSVEGISHPASVGRQRGAKR